MVSEEGVVTGDIMEGVMNLTSPNIVCYFVANQTLYSDELWKEYVDGN